MAKCGGRCWYCGAKPDPEELTVDHAKPWSRGGRNGDDNLLPACAYCNNEKSDLTLSEYRKYCKVKVIRRLMALGHWNPRVYIQFWGEGNPNPFAY